MGVDYDGVGGVGICIDDYLDQIIASGAFTREEWDEDVDDCLSRNGIHYAEAGSSYEEGNRRYYAFVEGENLEEVINNVPAFVEKFRGFGVVLLMKDIKIISDLLVW